MFHHNKGVVGLRMNGIEDALSIGLSVSYLTNESPLVSSACGSYEGPHDGGLSGTIDEEGGMGADLLEISIAGGDVLLLGANTIQSFNSFYGDAIGLDWIDNVVFTFDSGSDIIISDIVSASMLNESEYSDLEEEGKTPNTNNFDLCTVKYNDETEVSDCIWNTDFFNDS